MFFYSVNEMLLWGRKEGILFPLDVSARTKLNFIVFFFTFAFSLFVYFWMVEIGLKNPIQLVLVYISEAYKLTRELSYIYLSGRK